MIMFTPMSALRDPHVPHIVESQITGPFREDWLFSNLPPEAVSRLGTISLAASYPTGTTLFMEGDPGRGVFILASGRVKLSTSSSDGKTLIVRLSKPGEILGLPSTVTGKSYELTAEVIEPAQANFISRNHFLEFLCEHGNVALRVAQQLGQTYHAAIAEMRIIGLSHSAEERMARFILDLAADHHSENGAVKVKLAFSHEEIAQMIGTSRETVTRVFSHFRKKNLVAIRGSTLTVKDRPGLERLAQIQLLRHG